MVLNNTKHNEIDISFKNLPKYFKYFTSSLDHNINTEIFNNPLYNTSQLKRLENFNLVKAFDWSKPWPRPTKLDTMYTPAIIVSEGAVVNRDGRLWGDQNIKTFNTNNKRTKMYENFFKTKDKISDWAMATSTGITGISLRSDTKQHHDIFYVSNKTNDDPSNFESITNFIDIAPYSDIEITEVFQADASLKFYKNVYIVREGAKLFVTRIVKGDSHTQSHQFISSEVIQHPMSHVEIDTNKSYAASKYCHQDFHVECMQQTYTDIECKNYVDEHNSEDVIINIHHKGSDSFSRVNARSVVNDHGCFNFIGNIKVDKQAQHVDSDLVNKNLQLTNHAKVITQPRLDIATKEIKCSHGCTVSTVDADSMYLLNSRGISPDDAKELIISAFLGEI